MRTHRDVRLTRAHPKPARPVLGNESTTAESLSVGPSGNYRWYASLRTGAPLQGSGDINTQRGWYCKECGAPADLGEGDDVPSCCWRCGSTEAAEFREAT